MHRTLHHHDGTTRKIHLGGWKKQFTDPRDEEFSLKLHGSVLAIPTASSNQALCSPVEDQGELGSCTAHMFAGLVEFNEMKRINGKAAPLDSASTAVVVSNITTNAQGAVNYTTTVTPPAPTPPAPSPTPAPKLIRASRLFQYYATRKEEGTVNEDAGASIRDAIKAGALYGVADESLYPYNVSKFTVNPPQTVWTAAESHKVTSYHAITDGDLQTMKSVIVSGFLVGFGFAVYDYMMSAEMSRTGLLPPPQKSETLQGGHAVCLVGYDDTKIINADGASTKGAFLVRNSWGTSWAQNGYFWMAYDYVGNVKFANDFWIVQSSPI